MQANKDSALGEKPSLLTGRNLAQNKARGGWPSDSGVRKEEHKATANNITINTLQAWGIREHSAQDAEKHREDNGQTTGKRGHKDNNVMVAYINNWRVNERKAEDCLV